MLKLLQPTYPLEPKKPIFQSNQGRGKKTQNHRKEILYGMQKNFKLTIAPWNNEKYYTLQAYCGKAPKSI